MTIQSTISATTAITGSPSPLVGTTSGANHHHLLKAGAAGTAATTPSISVTLPSFAASLLSALGVTGNGQTGTGKAPTTLHL